MKTFSCCKKFNDVLIMYAKFLRNILLDATFSMIFKKIAKTKLNFFHANARKQFFLKKKPVNLLLESFHL